jgi:hypothetical protein
MRAKAKPLPKRMASFSPTPSACTRSRGSTSPGAGRAWPGRNKPDGGPVRRTAAFPS